MSVVGASVVCDTCNYEVDGVVPLVDSPVEYSRSDNIVYGLGNMKKRGGRIDPSLISKLQEHHADTATASDVLKGVGIGGHSEFTAHLEGGGIGKLGVNSYAISYTEITRGKER